MYRNATKDYTITTQISHIGTAIGRSLIIYIYTRYARAYGTTDLNNPTQKSVPNLTNYGDLKPLDIYSKTQISR